MVVDRVCASLDPGIVSLQTRRHSPRHRRQVLEALVRSGELEHRELESPTLSGSCVRRGGEHRALISGSPGCGPRRGPRSAPTRAPEGCEDQRARRMDLSPRRWAGRRRVARPVLATDGYEGSTSNRLAALVSRVAWIGGVRNICRASKHFDAVEARSPRRGVAPAQPRCPLRRERDECCASCSHGHLAAPHVGHDEPTCSWSLRRPQPSTSTRNGRRAPVEIVPERPSGLRRADSSSRSASKSPRTRAGDAMSGAGGIGPIARCARLASDGLVVRCRWSQRKLERKPPRRGQRPSVRASG